MKLTTLHRRYRGTASRRGFEKRVFVQKWEERIFGIHVAMMALSNRLKEAGSIPTKFRELLDSGLISAQGAEGDEPVSIISNTGITRNGSAEFRVSL